MTCAICGLPAEYLLVIGAEEVATCHGDLANKVRSLFRADPETATITVYAPEVPR